MSLKVRQDHNHVHIIKRFLEGQRFKIGSTIDQQVGNTMSTHQHGVWGKGRASETNNFKHVSSAKTAMLLRSHQLAKTIW